MLNELSRVREEKVWMPFGLRMFFVWQQHNLMREMNILIFKCIGLNWLSIITNDYIMKKNNHTVLIVEFELVSWWRFPCYLFPSSVLSWSCLILLDQHMLYSIYTAVLYYFDLKSCHHCTGFLIYALTLTFRCINNF